MLNALSEGVDAATSSWNELFPQWDMPEIWNGNGLYDSAGRIEWTDNWRAGPTCNGKSAEPDNAFYCPPNDIVAWDLVLLKKHYGAIGTRFIDVAIAHELGHGAQDRLRRESRSHLVWVQEEAQADCIAGAFMVAANRSGQIDVGGDGVDQMYATMVAIADSERWLQPGDHGDPLERVSAFETGVGGIENCIGPSGPPKPANPTDQAASIRTTLITPSGNITCADVGTKLKCTIKDFDFESACHEGGMPMVSMDILDPPTADSCAGLALGAVDPQPVQYGDQVEIGAFQCSVEQTGVTCTNSENHGFRLSRAALDLY